jgi:hypothetical protein
MPVFQRQFSARQNFDVFWAKALEVGQLVSAEAGVN